MYFFLLIYFHLLLLLYQEGFYLSINFLHCLTIVSS
ncbi:hypothetical protein [Staphylococcus phage vB_ScaM-V1SC04]|nr:hypothetical protein [Staphylococcus phage vB_ScaM-V1SC04]